MNNTLLKTFLIQKELTRSELAEKLGITKSTLSSKLSGKSEFTYKQVRLIANILNLTEDEIQDIFFND